MDYKLYDITRKQETSLELRNCTITGNNSAYVIKDGTITKFSIIDGEMDNSTAETVERIELTNYQLALFDLLKGKDGNAELLDHNDLKDLTSDSLKAQINDVYKEKNIYKAVLANITETKAKLSITDESNIEKKIAIEFEEEPGFFTKLCNGFCNVLKSIGKFFVNLFSSSKNEEPVETKPVENKRSETIVATTMIIGQNDEHNPITLSNDLGISYSRLKLVNPHLDLTQPLENGITINIPERKIVKPGTVTNISETAEAAGVSKEYVEDILFRIEGKNGIAAKMPYDDIKETIDDNGYPVPIKGRENWDNGTLTIGFGHTGRVFGQLMTRKNRDEIEISNNQAYELLAADLISAKYDAEEYYGEAFTNAPKSIQDAIVDIIFNKGLEKGLGIEKFEGCKEQVLTPQIKKCLENKDYAGCVSKLIYDTGLRGLHKRNYYRLISSMRDLSPKDREQAMNDIKYYYEKVCKLFNSKPTELKHIKNAWENAKIGICNNFMN